MTRRLVCVLVLAVVLASGCARVAVDPEYRVWLDKTTSWAGETATQAELGALTNAEMVTLLRQNAVLWKYFQNASLGIPNDGDGVPVSHELDILSEDDGVTVSHE